MNNKNNAIIRGRLRDILDVLDARTIVNVYVGTADENIPASNDKVMSLLADEVFMESLGNRPVIGITTGFGTSILISDSDL